MENSSQEQQIYDILKDTLLHFCGAVRLSVMRHWGELTRIQRRKTVGALSFMEDVAHDPAKYFSRATTMDSWRQRGLALNHAKYGDSDFHIYTRHSSPGDLVVNQASPAFSNALELQFWFEIFCNAIVDWEYARTSVNVRTQFQARGHIDKVKDIIKMSQKWDSPRKWRLRHEQKRRDYE